MLYLVYKYSTSFPYLSCWNIVFGLEAENLIEFEIYAVIWEIFVLNIVIVMPHLFWYGTSGDNLFSSPGRNYMRVSLTELFKSCYYSQNDIARMVYRHPKLLIECQGVLNTFFTVYSVSKRGGRVLECSETSPLATCLYRFFLEFLAVVYLLESVSQTVVRGPQVVLGFCPCGPLTLNISPKKTEKEKIKLT
jgi:hypothetical protein